jgi:hypothetical protein
VGVSVTENVTTVTATGDVTVEITENTTSVAVSDNTATLTVTPSETSVSVSGNTTAINVTSADTAINVTSDSIGTSGNQRIEQGTLYIELDKESGQTDGVYNDISRGLLRLTTTNRSNAGQFIQFRDTTLGTWDRTGGIGMKTNLPASSLFIGATNVGLHFTSAYGSSFIIPSDEQGDNNNDVQLGAAGIPFKDIYSQDGTVSTSDKTKKTNIEQLNQAEKDVAIACKELLRKYKWKTAVAEKGDDARWHFGIMAQDLQTAFSEGGLDAHDYGIFIKDEKEMDGVMETTYAVRYNELLAFIIAAL